MASWDMTECQQCRAALPEAADFCPECGQPARRSEPTPLPGSEERADDGPADPLDPSGATRTGGRGPKWALIALAAIAVLGLALGAVVFVGNGLPGVTQESDSVQPGRSSVANGVGKSDGPGDAEPQAKGRQYIAIQAANDFRIQGTNDYFQGLSKYAEEEAMVRFFGIADELWPFVDETLGWAYFFNSCLIVAPVPQGDWLPIGFYHPYSDVLLLTMWSVENETGPRLQDSEVFMGDFLRRKGKPPLSAERPWMRGSTYRPMAMLEAAADTISAFEESFSGVRAQAPGWREMVSGVSEPLVADNLVGAAMLLTKNFAQLRAYNDKSGKDAALSDLRSQVDLFIEQQGLIDMPQTPATHQIQALPEATWKSLRVVSYSNSDTQRLVNLAVSSSPDYFISLLFDVSGRLVSLARADLLSYSTYISKSKESL